VRIGGVRRSVHDTATCALGTVKQARIHLRDLQPMGGNIPCPLAEYNHYSARPLVQVGQQQACPLSDLPAPRVGKTLPHETLSNFAGPGRQDGLEVEETFEL